MSRAAPGSASILMYHSLDSSRSVVSVDPDRFAAQVRTMAELGVRGTTLSELVDAQRATGRWPDDRIALTFDDGYANLYEHALPALAEHGFGATVFIVSNHVGGSNDWAEPPAGLGTRRILTWSQIEELEAAGWEMGVHTRAHPDVSGLDEVGLEEQILGCRDDIEQRLGTRARSFAYPFGFTSPAAVELVGREFAAACTTVLRRASDEPRALLPRIDAYYLQAPGRMRALLEGRLEGYLRARRWARSLRGMLAGRAFGY